MDEKALYKLSYGVFVLGSKHGEKINACITNTAMQVAGDPVRIAIAVINKNLTCDYIKESGVFNLSLLDEDTTFDTIKNFGMQSGRDVDKFKDFPHKLDDRNVPYIEKETCAVIRAKVLESNDLGSHTLFIAEVIDSFMVSGKNPLTYADYHANVKPKKKVMDKKIVGWKCTICGYVYEGENIPDDYICPICGHPKEDFEPIYEE